MVTESAEVDREQEKQLGSKPMSTAPDGNRVSRGRQRTKKQLGSKPMSTDK